MDPPYWCSAGTGQRRPAGPTTKPPGDRGPGRLSKRIRSAGLAVDRVLAVAGAELLHLEPVGVVPTVLLGDVVALLAIHARQGDLGADIGALASHGATCSRN